MGSVNAQMLVGSFDVLPSPLLLCSMVVSLLAFVGSLTLAGVVS